MTLVTVKIYENRATLVVFRKKINLAINKLHKIKYKNKVKLNLKSIENIGKEII